MEAMFVWGSIKKFVESFLAMALMVLPVYAMMLIVILSTGGVLEKQIIITLFLLLAILSLAGIVISYASYKIITRKMIKDSQKEVEKQMEEKQIKGKVAVCMNRVNKEYHMFVIFACCEKYRGIFVEKDLIKTLNDYRIGFKEALNKEVNIYYLETNLVENHN